MNTIHKNIFIQRSDGDIEKLPIIINDSGISFANDSSQIFKGNDLFDSLRELRLFMESQGVKVLCNGSRKDVYPSRMSRGMGVGDKAYAMKIGHPARNNDLVDIFDYAPPAIISTVNDQEKFYKEWRESL